MLGFTYHHKIQQQSNDNVQDEYQDTSHHDLSHKHVCSFEKRKKNHHRKNIEIWQKIWYNVPDLYILFYRHE